MHYKLITYIILLIGSSILGAYSVIEAKYLLLLVATPILAYAITLIIKEFRTTTQRGSMLLNAIENNDYSFRFSDKGSDKHLKNFNKDLEKISQIIKQEKIRTISNEKYYELIIDNIDSGVFTIDSKGHIINHNNKALELLGIAVLTHISQIERVDKQLYNHIIDKENTKDNKTISIYNESKEIQLLIRKSTLTKASEDFTIICINDIQEQLEEKEQESWIRLIRVLTHEIMNTITPISSLSETLSHSSNPEELKEGLSVISSSSKGLISFVNTYRTLTKVPKPVKEIITLNKVLNKVLTLSSEEIHNKNISLELKIEPEDLMIYADENLITQVLINLVKNAIAAMEETKNPMLKITASINPDSEDISIDISNNGPAISQECQDHIFIPFFTTKDSGSGIGLSISRQIMRLHNGSIKLKSSTDSLTTFSITLP